ncbi:endonuclease 8-like 1 [Colossoma macropomum]|uniref:endonuclease 8-like 1 n=1 Tax=Colossoma macropomum TaxID=42526 RepID=UPI0018642672|nr:endonuclease 8-like 1 [Colossoma macropomum]
MPEGPELHLASLFVNRVCAGVVFSGHVEKSDVSKGPQVPFSSDAYRISATSRGKEVRLTLTPIKSDRKSKVKAEEDQPPMDVVFRFGMSGYFRFTAVDELPKHAHVRFYTNEDPQRALSFVDTRRFGSWQPNGIWQRDRGPCVMFEYESFRENVLSNLSDKAFDRPICEALLNQKYFNGIGNYLRAEILYRANIPPFVKARSVLEGLSAKDEKTKEVKEAAAEKCDAAGKREVKTGCSDILSLCHSVPLEVIDLGGKGYDPGDADFTEFESWLQCYYVDGMNSISDHNGRTIWFKGDSGPMAPKGSKSLKTKRRIKKSEHDYTDSKKAAKKKRTGSISNEKPVKKDPGPVKKVKYVPRRQSGTRRQNASKKRLDTEAAGENKIPKTRKKSNSTGPQTSKAKSTRRQSVQESNTKPKRTTRSQKKSSTEA